MYDYCFSFTTWSFMANNKVRIIHTINQIIYWMNGQTIGSDKTKRHMWIWPRLWEKATDLLHIWLSQRASSGVMKWWRCTRHGSISRKARLQLLTKVETQAETHTSLLKSCQSRRKSCWMSETEDPKAEAVYLKISRPLGQVPVIV